MNLTKWSVVTLARSRVLLAFPLALGLVFLGNAKPSIDIGDLSERMRSAETFSGSFCGKEVVVIQRVGVSPPDLSRPEELALEPDGEYRWYVDGSDWWMVKDIPLVSPAAGPGTDINIVQNYQGRILAYADFRDDKGGLWFGGARLSDRHDQAYLGPLLGRRWWNASIADMVRSMSRVTQSHSSAGYELDGEYHGSFLHLTIATQNNYLVTSLVLRSGTSRSGYRINKVKQIGKDWVPELAEVFNGESRGNDITLGFTGQIRFFDFAPHGRPTREEVPPIVPGGIFGSEGNRLYRVAQDGTLVDFGRQGSKPGTPLAWGDLFVLSGAGILLTSLSWLVFRKRKAESSLKSKRRRG